MTSLGQKLFSAYVLSGHGERRRDGEPVCRRFLYHFSIYSLSICFRVREGSDGARAGQGRVFAIFTSPWMGENGKGVRGEGAEGEGQVGYPIAN